MAIDGTERRRQRPTNAAQQQEQYSGKKKTHTDKNLLLVNEHTDKVIYLGPTVAGKSTTRKPPRRRRLPTRPMPRSPRTRAFRAMSQREC